MTPTLTLKTARRAAAALVVAGALVGCTGPGTASAASVDIAGNDFSSLVFFAAPGENNKVAITRPTPFIVRVDDVYGINIDPFAAERCEHPFLLDGTVVDCHLTVEAWVHLNDGNDTVTPGPGTDHVFGGSGFDRVSYSERSNPVTVTPGTGADDGEPGEQDSVNVEGVTGGAGNDTIIDLVGGANAFDGGPGNDKINGGDGDDPTLVGGDGHDTIDGGNGKDMLFAGAGDDKLAGGSDNDLLNGEAGLDTLVGGSGADLMSGGGGFDVVSYWSYAAGVTVDLDGEADDGLRREFDNVTTDVEQVNGGSGSDVLTGNANYQLLIGGAGNDVIDGGLGADGLHGNEDSDTLHSDDGVKDSVSCGAGIDGVDADALDDPVDCETRG